VQTQFQTDRQEEQLEGWAQGSAEGFNEPVFFVLPPEQSAQTNNQGGQDWPQQKKKQEI
jgi:hypothetical protein